MPGQRVFVLHFPGRFCQQPENQAMKKHKIFTEISLMIQIENVNCVK